MSHKIHNSLGYAIGVFLYLNPTYRVYPHRTSLEVKIVHLMWEERPWVAAQILPDHIGRGSGLSVAQKVLVQCMISHLGEADLTGKSE